MTAAVGKPPLRRPLQPLGDPQLDQSLPGHPEAARLAIEPRRFAPVDVAGDVRAGIEFPVEIKRFQRLRPPPDETERQGGCFSRFFAFCDGTIGPCPRSAIRFR